MQLRTLISCRQVAAAGTNHLAKGWAKAHVFLPCIVREMASAGDLRVSRRGQMNLAVEARHRWGLDGGGVAYLDRLRSALLESVTEETWGAARSGFGDPELANE